MNRCFSFALAMSLVALMMLSGCGSHTMPDGTKMDNKGMTK